jgi:hypothetical protein
VFFFSWPCRVAWMEEDDDGRERERIRMAGARRSL